jgi:uncharacterized OB-fold protein
VPEPPLAMHDFPGDGDPTHLLPRANRDSAPFFEGLRTGRLTLQRCGECARVRNPVAPVCPHCGGESFEWQQCGGGGTVHSWVRYRRSYLPEFESLMPYVVVSVALDEGPRMFGRLANGDADPQIGMRVQAVVERLPSGACVPAFVAVEAQR